MASGPLPLSQAKLIKFDNYRNLKIAKDSAVVSGKQSLVGAALLAGCPLPLGQIIVLNVVIDKVSRPVHKHEVSTTGVVARVRVSKSFII